VSATGLVFTKHDKDLLWGTPREIYELGSFAHILAMLWPFASTGNLGIQLVLKLIDDVISEASAQPGQ